MGGEFASSTNGTTTQSRLVPVDLRGMTGRRRSCNISNYIYKSEPALWQQDDTYEGFEWIDFHDGIKRRLIYAQMRRGRKLSRVRV